MADMGQCKTCRKGVSTEALACPHCGQPDPALSIPPDGSVETATVSDEYHGDHSHTVWATLKNGAQVSFDAHWKNRCYHAGEKVHVRILTSHNNGMVSAMLVE